jgi:putative addiction module component (TIGR02574 family)
VLVKKEANDMSASLKDIEEQALTLKAEERARLVESLLETLHAHRSDIEAAWESEIQERVAAFDRGEMPSYPAEEVFAEARQLTR